MARPRKSYLEYVDMRRTFDAFMIAYFSAGPKARKRFKQNEKELKKTVKLVD